MVANITAKVSAEATLKATLTAVNSVVGVVSIPLSSKYDGDYSVTPKAHEEQVLATKGKVMQDNLTVLEIPFFEVSNALGKTIYIGSEVAINGN